MIKRVILLGDSRESFAYGRLESWAHVTWLEYAFLHRIVEVCASDVYEGADCTLSQAVGRSFVKRGFYGVCI